MLVVLFIGASKFNQTKHTQTHTDTHGHRYTHKHTHTYTPIYHIYIYIFCPESLTEIPGNK